MTPSRDDYARVFHEEQQQSYPVVDALETELGVSLERARLEAAARVLACPLKAHAPNWQHGRVLYALTRDYIAEMQPQDSDSEGVDAGAFMWTPTVNILDIGTAKGFSALCMLWAIHDEGALGTVTSVDVIDPMARVRRNTVAECDGFKTLAETQAEFPDAADIKFLQMTGVEALKRGIGRIHVAFVDGKHSHDAVALEAQLLSGRQQPGDLAIFDDAHIEGVRKAIRSAESSYHLRYLYVRPEREYAIGTRRG